MVEQGLGDWRSTMVEQISLAINTAMAETSQRLEACIARLCEQEEVLMNTLKDDQLRYQKEVRSSLSPIRSHDTTTEFSAQRVFDVIPDRNSVFSHGFLHYSCDNGFGYDGFLSDEIKFVNVIEKPVFASLDNENSGVEESVVSKLFVTNPNEKNCEDVSKLDKGDEGTMMETIFTESKNVGGQVKMIGYDELRKGIGLGGPGKMGLGFGVGYMASGSGGGPGDSYGGHGGIGDEVKFVNVVGQSVAASLDDENSVDEVEVEPQVFDGSPGKEFIVKSQDPSPITSVTLEDPHTEDLSQKVRGFIFSRILERKPELTTEIMDFIDSLLSSTVSDTLKVWELKDLGHQTAQKIVRSSDPLILSMFENSLPMRFGVILYSTKFIQKLETSGGEFPSGGENGSEREEDLSNLIIRLFIYIKENNGIQMDFQFLSNVNRLRLDSGDFEDAPEMHYIEAAFVDTTLPKAKEVTMVDDMIVSVSSRGILPIATTPPVKEVDGKVVGGDENHPGSDFASQDEVINGVLGMGVVRKGLVGQNLDRRWVCTWGSGGGPGVGENEEFIEEILASQGANRNISNTCSIHPSNLTKASCPNIDVIRIERILNFSRLSAACKDADPVDECCNQVCRNDILDAAEKITINNGDRVSLNGIDIWPAKSSIIDDCRDIIIRGLASKLDLSSSNRFLRGISQCSINKVCPLVFPDIKNVTKEGGDMKSNRTACLKAMGSYMSETQEQSFITNLQTTNCATLLGKKLQTANISQNIYALCHIKLKDFSLQVGSQDSGCLFPSLPSDVKYDQNTGISFICDLNDKVEASWPTTSFVPASLCNKIFQTAASIWLAFGVQGLEKNLLLDNGYKSEGVFAAPTRVVQILYNTGYVKVPQTVTFNFPNELHFWYSFRPFDLEDKVVLWERSNVMDWANTNGLLNFKRSRPKEN